MLIVHAIPAFDDNYFWLLQPDPDDRSAYIIDPGAAAPVLAALAERQLLLAGIIITHHHHDHIDGVRDLCQITPVPVYGPRSAKIPQVTHYLTDGEQLRLPSLVLDVLAVPGHTLDHIAYLHQPGNQPGYSRTEQAAPASLFCGDTLFAGGCGRLFDGTASQLFASLMRLAQLDDSTLVYCAHEYTLANLKFACAVEPGNKALVERLQNVTQLRRDGRMTVPTTLGVEKQTNPYLRVHVMTIKRAVEDHAGLALPTPEAVFTAIRRWKDQF